MPKYNEVFNRVEKKYLLNQETMLKLCEELTPYIDKDDYFNYSIYNLYYDSEDSQMIRTSLQKSAYKEKLRLRSYTPADENSIVFIEMKKKIMHTVFKRRITYHGKDDTNLRITFDKNIRYRNDSLCLRDSEHDKFLLKEGQYLMEIKLHESFPIWLSNILTKLNIYPTSFSKYGEIYTRQLKKTIY